MKYMGKSYTFKEVITDISPTAHTMKMYMGEGGGPEALVMTLKLVKQ